MSEAELETFRAELSNILEQFEVLSSADTRDVPPTAHPIDVSNVFRDDVSGTSLDQEGVLSNAPQREDDYFRVKAVLEE